MIPRDLLAQADHLCRLSPKRPKQANLRRAVSASYYAVFHALCRSNADALVGKGAARPTRAWMQTYRALDHAQQRADVKKQGQGVFLCRSKHLRIPSLACRSIGIAQITTQIKTLPRRRQRSLSALHVLRLRRLILHLQGIAELSPFMFCCHTENHERVDRTAIRAKVPCAAVRPKGCGLGVPGRIARL